MRWVLPLLAAAWVTAGSLSADAPKTVEDYRKLVTPALRKILDEQFALLNRWPDKTARKAAEAIIEIGDPAVSDVLRELGEGHWRAQIASAYIAGELKAPIAFDAVLASSRSPRVQRYLGTYFGALAKIDGDAAVGALLRSLASRTEDTRDLAFKYLAGLVKAKHLPQVLELATHDRAPTRAKAMKLLGIVGGPQARTLLVQSLADEDPSTASAASVALAGGQTDDALVAELKRGLETVDRRTRAYVALTLVRIEDLTGGQVFDDAIQQRYLKGLTHAEPFVRGTSAVVLANASRYSKLPAVHASLDKVVVPVLIRTLGTSTYYRDYRSLRALSRTKLRQLTGEDFGFDFNRWTGWWRVNGGRFEAIRRLEVVPPSRIRELQIRLARKIPGRTDDDWVFRCSYSPRRAQSVPDGRQYVISDIEMGQLFGELRGAGLLTHSASRGGAAAPNTSRWTVELALGRRARRLTAAGTLPEWMPPLIDVVERWAARNEWQLYWDQRTHRDRNVWYESFRRWWKDRTHGELEANRKLKSMIVTSFEFLRPGERVRAAARLSELTREDPYLRPAQAEIVMALLMAVGGFEETARHLARALARARQPSIARPLIAYLLRHQDPAVQPILEDLFGHTGKAVALAYLEHRESRLRAAACAGIWRYGGPEVEVKLVRALQDSSPLVQAGAAFALGKRRTRLALPALIDLLDKTDNPQLQATILPAIGRIGGSAAFKRLLQALETAKGEQKGAVLSALGETEHEAAVQPVLAAYLQAPVDDPLRAVAATALLKLPRSALGKHLLPPLRNVELPLERRLAVLAVVGRVRGRLVAQALHPLLTDPAPRIRQEAALILAYRRDTAALPVLIELLADHPERSAVRFALEALTMVQPPADVPLLDGYRAFHKNHGNVTWRMWLFSALREGYEVQGLIDWSLTGAKPDARGIEVLILALLDDRWYVAHGASHALAMIFGIDRRPLTRTDSDARRRETARIWREVWASKGGGKKK